METILVKPKNEKQQSVLISLFKEMKVSFKPVKEEVSEGDKFYPILEEKIIRARKNKEQGNTVTLKTTDSLDDFLEKIMADESI